MFGRIRESFKKHLLPNIFIVILLLLVIFLIYWSFVKKHVNPVPTSVNSQTQEKNKLVYLPGLESNYFIPNQTSPNNNVVDDNKDNNVSSTANDETSNVPTLNDNALDFNLEGNLYQYVGKSSVNAISSVRRPKNETSSFNTLTGKAFAANRSYPVVFYVDYNDKFNNIIELNMFNGEKTTIISEPVIEGHGTSGVISGLSFNEEEQVLAYKVVSEMKNSVFVLDIKIYDLNSESGEVVAKTSSIDQIVWSPNGKKLAFTKLEPDLSSASNYGTLGLYDFDTKSIQYADNVVIGGSSQIGNTWTYTWATDSNSLIFSKPETAPGPRPNYEGYAVYDEKITPPNIKFFPYSYSLETGQIRKLTENPSNVSDTNLILTGNKLFSYTVDNYEIYKYYSINGAEPRKQRPSAGDSVGWLGLVDVATNKVEDLRQQTGDYMQQFLVKGDGTQVVYKKSSGSNQDGTYKLHLEVLDTNSKQIENFDDVLEPLHSSYSLVGWNGNGENITLWSGSNKFYNLNIKTKKLTLISKK